MDLPFERGQRYLTDYGFVSNVAIPQPHPEEVPPIAEAELEEVVAFHKTFRDEVVRSGLGDRYDPLWGRYLPEERWSTTHFSLPMLTNSLFGRRDRVWMFQPGHPFSRRFCTMRICVRPNGAPAKPTIIFRGNEDYVSQHELDRYANDVEVLYSFI